LRPSHDWGNFGTGNAESQASFLNKFQINLLVCKALETALSSQSAFSELDLESHKHRLDSQGMWDFEWNPETSNWMQMT